ncbi:MAG: serine/threonine protein kinase [Thiohalophilus sp.]
MPDTALPYANLTPALVLDAVEACGFQASGALLALNSYENRVYQVGLDDGSFLVTKIYRPGRWSDAAILEEHAFARELAELEIPVVAPLPLAEGGTLLHHADYRLALYPRRGGRPPELEDPEHLRWLGRMLGRIHACGSQRLFRHRPRLNIELLGTDPYHYLMEHDFIPADLAHNYRQAAEQLLGEIESVWQEVARWVDPIRLHGDCHPGNILWTGQGPHFVDLDDCMIGPAVQDLWMLLSGDRGDMTRQLGLLLDGYSQFYDFNALELRLIEALRGLRLIHYSGWLARRWHDPAFPMHFPWFNTPRYWEDQLNTLREQLERLDQPPLEP